MLVDASVVVAVLLDLDHRSGVARARLEVDESLAAPEVMDLEVTSVLRRLALVGVVSSDRAGDALTDLFDLPITRLSHAPLIGRCWELRENLTGYDAAYVAAAAAAEMLDATLVTADARIAGAPGVRCPVEVIA